MFNAPEFKRQLWLELSPIKLLIALAIIAAVYFLNEKTGSSYSSTEDTSHTSIIGIVLISILYGSYKSANSFHDEIRNNTWDFQKTSPLSATQLTLGKIFGSTLFTWIISAAIYIAFFNAPLSPTASTINLILCIITAQATTFAITVYRESNKLDNTTGGTFLNTLIGAAFGINLLTISTVVLDKTSVNFTWYGITTSPDEFYRYLICYITAFALIAAIRNMRQQLQHEDAPYMWLAFLLSSSAIILGLQSNFDDAPFQLHLYGTLGIVYAMMGGATYFTIVTDAGNKSKLLFFIHAIKTSNTQKILTYFPKWAISLTLTFATYAAILLIPTATNAEADVALKALISVSTLIIIRDCAVLLTIFTATNNKHSLFYVIGYILGIHVLLPLMFTTAFYPNPIDIEAITFISLGIQAAAAIGMMIYFARQRKII